MLDNLVLDMTQKDFFLFALCNPRPGILTEGGRLSTVDLLVLSSLDQQLPFMLKILLNKKYYLKENQISDCLLSWRICHQQ
jgi:hypothetical protein